MNDNLFNPRNTNAIAGTSTSQTRMLPGGGATNTVGGPTAVFYNDGPGLAFVVTGAATVVAVAPTLSTNVGTLGHMPLPIGQSIPIQLLDDDAYWAVVSISTSNVYCTRGDGR